MDNLRQMFLDQFEEADGRLVYRRYQKGAATPLSADERAQLVAEYDRRTRYLMRAFMALVFLWIIALTLYYVQRGQEPSMWGVFAGLAVLLAGFVWVQRWVWDGPRRRLVGRLPVGGERSRAEMRRIAMERLTWPRIGGMAAIALFLLFNIDRDQPLLGGENLFWAGMAVTLLGAAAFAALGKLRGR